MNQMKESLNDPNMRSQKLKFQILPKKEFFLVKNYLFG